MTSTILDSAIDDDDEFDWEAAVREIDVACHAPKPCDSNPVADTKNSSSSNTCQNSFASSSRQSTLDKFVQKPAPGVATVNRKVLDIHQDDFEIREGFSCVEIDAEAAKTWIYPVNVPLRDYQLSITRTSLFSNTLVVLPTGLGKTLIAAVVMYNYFRWYPEGKIIFAAPSRPLVMQQIEACHNIVGISQEWTIDMTGQTSPTVRACLWKTKRVFFVTPQVLEKDIQSGTCVVKNLVCLVIDEAHRALGNYSYCVVVRELMALCVQLRILALTATPGSKQQTIQDVINNLQISTLEYRNESDHDVIPYVHDRKIEIIEVAMSQDAVEVNNILLEVIHPFVARLRAMGVLQQNREFQTVSVSWTFVACFTESTMPVKETFLKLLDKACCTECCSKIGAIEYFAEAGSIVLSSLKYFQMLSQLQSQDQICQDLSPCDLLNSRDKFRQAPPMDLPPVKYGEVEGYFGVLITLYHIRKLLSSHGIRPAYEMLEDKLQQGSFARFMSRNEVMGKAKLLMQKNLSHGAPSPKLSKMLEILIDHFKTKDPTKSRVIIFSNFRGSVRDIMDALINVGDFVKATQFVGQSSGKAFKGQSQKSQQAVLEKFRAGGYNVIVATSIGEEGLDIMEVDLVICFDANISPLRMIQRMGRTGRKHDGRVVVLACKGSELKGYMRKQASGKAIKKHMKNGGITSFNFHSSPRMIPHIFRPEVQFIELSIEQFVPRGKKVKNKMKDHLSVQTPKFDSNLTATETDLLAKYFHPSKNGSWRPSLIAFPYFQAFPSRVYKVTHSLRTEMLINSVQFLQGLSSTWHSKTFFLENEPQSGIGLQIETADEHNYSMRDLQSSHNSPEEHLLREVSDYDPLPVETSATEEKCYSSDSHIKKPVVLLSCLKQESFQSENLAEDCKVVTARKDSSDQTSQKSFGRNRKMLTSKLCNTDALKENMLDGAEEIQQTSVSKLLIADSTDETINENKAELLIADDAEEVQQTSVSKGKMLNERDSTDEAINENRAEVLIADDSSNALRDIELSPRLTNFIQRGVVPESPIEYSGGPEGRGKLVFTDIGSPGKSPTGGLQEHSVPEQNEKMVEYSNASGQEISASSPKEIFQTPLLNMKCSTTKGNISPFSIFEVKTPLSNATNDSCSKNWQLTSGGKSESVQQVKKFKRLRKYVDQVKWKLSERKEENFGSTTSLIRTFGSPSHILCNNGRGRRKLVRNVKAFIEEEAEVSSEVEVSDDENDEQDDNSYDDSFIDDRMDLTVASTQAEASRTDMMAIYRRSLLSQSPMNRLPSCSSDCSPNSVASNIQTGESGSSLEMVNCALHTKIDSESAGRISNSSGYKYRSVSEGMSGTINGIPRGNDYNLGARKRKLSFHPPGSVPAINLDEEFLSPSEVAAKETNLQDQAEKIQLHGDVFDDDQFYESLDLDAVEEQAAKILGHKSELAEKLMIPDPTCQQLDDLGSPSFDLGI